LTGDTGDREIQDTGRYKIRRDTRCSEIQEKKDSGIWRCRKQEYSGDREI
jgi:hypothetical protein